MSIIFGIVSALMAILIVTSTIFKWWRYCIVSKAPGYYPWGGAIIIGLAFYAPMLAGAACIAALLK
jgi:hypothetical protein